MVEREQLDVAAFGIPARAWGLAIAAIVLAVVATFAMPGPAVEGSLHSKGCNFTPRAPILLAGMVLALGSALSIWIGAVPRHWVAGWTATIAGITGLVVGLLMLVATPDAFTSRMRIWSLAGGICFFTSWAVQMPLGLLAASLPSPFRPRLPAAVPMPDDRPRWLQDIDATLALIEHGRGSLRASDLQHVAELAFTLGNDSHAPMAVRDHAARIRLALASVLEGSALRDAVVVELRTAAAVGARDPYRDR